MVLSTTFSGSKSTVPSYAWSEIILTVVLHQVFHAGGYSSWTMKHAFFADMGGFLLKTPGWKPFPLDAQQLYYMVSRGYLKYPEIEKATIDDKDKADGVARYATEVLLSGSMLQY
jgi:hypothetical protein